MRIQQYDSYSGSYDRMSNSKSSVRTMQSVLHVRSWHVCVHLQPEHIRRQKILRQHNNFQTYSTWGSKNIWTYNFRIRPNIWRYGERDTSSFCMLLSTVRVSTNAVLGIS